MDRRHAPVRPPRPAPRGPGRPPAPDEPPSIVLALVRDLVEELHPGHTGLEQLGLHSDFEQDLGLGSLGRVELLGRIERALGVSFPEQTLARARTPADLLAALPETGARRPVSRERLGPVAPPVEASWPAGARNLVEVLEFHAETHGDRPHVRLLAEADAVETLTYAQLLAGARRVAAGLWEHGVEPRQQVAIMLPTSLHYLTAFFGVLLAGAVPVPIYPPARPSQLEDHLRRHAAILGNAQAVALITVPEARRVARLLKSLADGLRAVLTPEQLSESRGQAPPPRIAPADIAMLQYTSGSTGQPKGVVLSHGNLLANIRAMGQAAEVKRTDVMVSWLPLYHDMGLIGSWLSSLYFALPLVLMSPLSFLVRPERWLWAIHRHGGTISASPNFGYELCVRKVDEADTRGLDLSSWRMALNGAEPVSPRTLERFAERFGPHGFRRASMAPVYGLAESAVGLAFPPVGRGPLVDRVHRDTFARTGRALPATDEPSATEFVACGRPLRGHQIRIVDETGHEAPERQQGRLQFRGPSCTRGYFRNEAQTRALFDGDWLDSGDLAYTARGDVYLTGRVKDLIIRAGRNIHPQELEEAIGNLDGIRKGCVAAFASRDPGSGTEQLVVLAETREQNPLAHGALQEWRPRQTFPWYPCSSRGPARSCARGPGCRAMAASPSPAGRPCCPPAVTLQLRSS